MRKFAAAVGEPIRITEDYFIALLHEREPLKAISGLVRLWSTRPHSNQPSLSWLTGPERHAHAFAIYTGEVGNGGHGQFFFNRGSEITTFVREGLATSGLDDLRRYLDAACELFPGGRVPASRDEIDSCLAKLSEAERARMHSLDVAVWKTRDADARMMAFLRLHSEEILRPERGLGILTA